LQTLASIRRSSWYISIHTDGLCVSEVRLGQAADGGAVVHLMGHIGQHLVQPSHVARRAADLLDQGDVGLDVDGEP
jgi:hypothetical protein